jgi:glycosyltransferase involved in cell wall biosynthesis
MSKLLVVSPTPSHPQNAGNRSRIYNLLSAVRSLGHEVHFFHIQVEPGGDEAAMRSYWGERYLCLPYEPPEPRRGLLDWFRRLTNREARFVFHIDEWYDGSVDPFLVQLAAREQFDAVLVEYVFFSRALACFDSSTLKMIDTHDVFTNRHRLYLEHGQTPAFFSTTAEEEAKGLNRADVIIAIQDKEREFFADLVTKDVVTVGHLTALHEPRSIERDTNKALFVGSANPVNVHGMTWFIDEVLPRVRRRFADFQLLLVGPVCDALPDARGCTKLGEVEDMETAYEQADLVINPILFGTGLKVKTIEALGHAKPVVTTSCGAEGLGSTSCEGLLVADSSTRFADAMDSVLSNRQLGADLAKRAYRFAADWNRQNIEKLVAVLP